jgi:putative acetyltransferase
VLPDMRGTGLGRELLEALEAQARRLGYKGIVLETGNRQPEALGLYTSAGFGLIPCYGPYAAQATSRCFEKTL